jgi:predicted AAA+ superfamily ATPase
MYARRITGHLTDALGAFPAVALLGPRQAGKTTLARSIAAERAAIYLDLESPRDRAKLTVADQFLEQHEHELVILDEVQRAPELFQILRGLIDSGRQRGVSSGRFLLLGSASMELLSQSGESLAGRIAYLELAPFDPLEVDEDSMQTLWVRGGFPDSFLAASDALSASWRENFIRTYLERDIPALGPRIPAETLRRFWTMLAHAQGGLFNAAALARSLSVDGKTISRYLDLMVDLLLVRRLPPYHANVRKRLVKAPKIYVRDTGLVHTLLQLDALDALVGHPSVGASWEAFVLEALLRAAPARVQASFYRTAAGAEIDLVLEVRAGELWAIEVKHGSVPKLERGFHSAREDLQPARSLVVYSGTERYPMGVGIEAIGVRDAARLVAELA